MSKALVKDANLLTASTLRDYGINYVPSSRRKIMRLIDKGWEETYGTLFGESFVEVLDSVETDDRHHSEAIRWHWLSRLALLTGDKPKYYSYFPIWSRGHMKSTIAEYMVCIDGVLSYAYNAQGYCLYIGRERDRVQENISNLDVLFSSPRVREYCPELGDVAINQETDQKKKWTATMLQTSAGYIVKGATIDSAQAGSRIKTGLDVRDVRVTFFVPDDIDDREDSPATSSKRFKKLTTEILPMKQENTLTFFAQNLISRYSVMYRIQKGQAKVLTNRKPTQPIPAVRNLVTEEKNIDGIVKDVVLSGQCTWQGWNLERVQNEIDTMGLPAFLTECQHEVDASREGRILHNYDDNVHAISISEFESRYGSREAWKSWFKVVGNDWARTKSQYHANVAGYLAVSSQSTPLPGMTYAIPISFAAETTPEDVAVRLLTMLTPQVDTRPGAEYKTWTELVDECFKRVASGFEFKDASDRIKFLKSYYSRVIPEFAKPVLRQYNVRAGAMSHSEDKIRDLYNSGFGFNFQPSNPHMFDAVERINQEMKVDYNSAHLFRPWKKGYTRWYVLCPDDLEQEPRIINGIKVYPPVPFPDVADPSKLHDSDLFRYQMINWRTAPPELTKTGERIDVIEKMNDDYGQMLQMIYHKRLLANIPLTPLEMLQAKMPDKLKEKNIKTVEDRMGQQLFLQRELAEIERKTERQQEASGRFLDSFR